MKYSDKAEKISDKLHKKMGLSASDIMFGFIGIMNNYNQKSYEEVYTYNGETYKVMVKKLNVHDNSEEILNEFNRFRKAFNFDTHRMRTETSKCWLWRVFVYAMILESRPINCVARVVGRDHVTLMYHRDRITEQEKRLAEYFVADKNYIYNEEAEKLREAKRHLWYGRKK